MKQLSRTLRLAIFSVILLISVLLQAEVQPLSQQTLIRVYISNAPGLGHQSASVVVMRRLRQLGFAGTFEVIYNDNIAGKLNTLLPGFSPQQRDWQVLEDLKIRAIAESQFRQLSSLPQVEIAITGADDNRQNMTAEKMFSKNYILLEPQGWGDSFLFQAGASRPSVIPGLQNLGYTYDIDSSPEAIQAALHAIRNNPEFADKVPGLRALMEGPAIWGAIYGVGLIPNMPERIKIWVQGIQMANRALKIDQALILPIISPLNEFEMLTLKWELEQLEKAQPGHRKKKIMLLDIKDPLLPSVRAEMKAGDILLVQTGRLPQSLFEAVFKKSTLPVLVAGKNAMNLAQNLGKAYINTVHDLGFQVAAVETAEQKSIREASEVFYYSRTQDVYIRRLSKFIQSAMDPNSTLALYFKNLSNRGPDKVAEALRFLNSQSPSASPSCQAVFLQ